MGLRRRNRNHNPPQLRPSQPSDFIRVPSPEPAPEAEPWHIVGGTQMPLEQKHSWACCNCHNPNSIFEGICFHCKIHARCSDCRRLDGLLCEQGLGEEYSRPGGRDWSGEFEEQFSLP